MKIEISKKVLAKVLKSLSKGENGLFHFTFDGRICWVRYCSSSTHIQISKNFPLPRQDNILNLNFAVGSSAFQEALDVCYGDKQTLTVQKIHNV